MARKKDVILTALFCGFIGAMALGTAFLPKQEISVNEKRTLAKFPEFTVEKLIDGQWGSDFEEYISDHFPARNFFTSADVYYMLCTGRNGANGVYKGKDGYLFNIPVKCDDSKKNANINAVIEFAAKTGIETKLMVVPSSGYIMDDKLPAVHEEYADGSIMEDIKKDCAGIIEAIELTDVFRERKDSVSLYYKTDHHWTSEGAYTAYCMWAKSEGIEPREKADFDIEKYDGFYGTAYTKSALWLEKPDTLEIWKYPSDVTVSISDGIQNTEYDSMFFENHLDESDKYPVFLDGNHGFERIINHGNPQGKRILLIKDSYAHSLAPFMAEECSMIDMVDLRYYFDSVSLLAEENKYDEVLVVYGISNICKANDLSILQ